MEKKPFTPPPVRLPPVSFAAMLLKQLPPGAGISAIEPLARLDYPAELKLKSQTFFGFWRTHKLPGQPEPLIPSPRPRHYRTVTKRRTVFHRGWLQLAFGGQHPDPKQPVFIPSAVEPDEHTAIYKFLQEKLSLPAYHPVSRNLNYLIIRGSYTEFTVIFNLNHLNAEIVRKLKKLSEHLKPGAGALPRIISCFAFQDPARSEYYLESKDAGVQVRLKNLFGPDRLFLGLGERKYLFPIGVFSQVNESMLPVMLSRVRELLQPRGQGRLLDLYCGYGLFSAWLHDGYHEIYGTDLDHGSVDAAVDNFKRTGSRAKYSFAASRITMESLHRFLPPAKPRETIILDPPRTGTAPRVIEYLATRHPGKVLHIFCGVDEIPRAIQEWRRAGYAPLHIVPLDMFPGTPNLEVMVLLEKRRE
jgi:tRNA/tmRNA/rRNA uracil-C5-methylase (TrmA/RlmC/RlmD family)